jgi:hypothetical protein
LAWLAANSVNRYVVIDHENDELDDLPLFQPTAEAVLTNDIENAAADYFEEKTVAKLIVFTSHGPPMPPCFSGVVGCGRPSVSLPSDSGWLADFGLVAPLPVCSGGCLS